jgi:uncharacterized protein (TIGR02996 family)
MSEDERALLNTVIAYPADDVPRLVYADYLEETATRSMCEACDGTGVIESGQGRQKVCAACTLGYVSDGRAERAEFIRVGCELASMGFPGPLSMAVARTAAASKHTDMDPLVPSQVLSFRLAELFVQWSESWGDSPGYTLWSRGFVDEVRCDERWWYGMPCGRCSASGDTGLMFYKACASCDNGYVGDHGTRIVSVHPVRRVVFPSGLMELGKRAIDAARYRCRMVGD